MIVRNSFLTLATLSCAAVPSSPTSRDHGEPFLPPATRAIHVWTNPSEQTLGDLLDQLAEVTGQTLIMLVDTRMLVDATAIPASGGRRRASAGASATGPGAPDSGALTVPADEVYAFVEGWLAFHSLTIMRVKGGETPVLAVRGRGGAVQSMDRHVVVDPNDLERLAEHPALLVQTTLELRNLDTRQLATSLRGMLRDTSLQTILPIGEHALLVQGPAAFVAELGGIALEVDRYHERAASTADPEDGSRPTK